MTYNLTVRQHWLLVEALRRFECFAKGGKRKTWAKEDVMRAWTGLGSRTDYKPAADAGLMVIHGDYPPRVDCWWRLTDAGADIVLHWHRLGFKCDDKYLVVGDPPRKGDTTSV